MKHPTIFRIFLALSLGGPAVAHAQAPAQDLRSLQGTWAVEGTREVRDHAFEDGLLSYAVPASAYGGGTVAYSVRRHVGPLRP